MFDKAINFVAISHLQARGDHLQRLPEWRWHSYANRLPALGQARSCEHFAHRRWRQPPWLRAGASQAQNSNERRAPRQPEADSQTPLK